MGGGALPLLDAEVPLPNPRVVSHTADAGQRGWRRHVLLEPLSEYQTALCGLVPSHGWGYDMFIDKPCERCLKKLTSWGIVVPIDYLGALADF